MTHQSLFSSALLVEDEPSLATALKIALQKLDIPTHYVSNLKAAKHHIDAIPPEMIILDRTLPDGDGLDLCLELRKKHYSGTILILTASGQIQDRVNGLNSGADDYLAKPFSWEELEARIKALARRKTSFHKITRSTQLWTLDRDQLRIFGPKGWITLTPLEFKLASAMIHKPQSIISRDDLLKDVWGFTLLPKTRTVDHFLGRLRKHFEIDPEEPLHFLTIRGAGYKFSP